MSTVTAETIPGMDTPMLKQYFAIKADYQDAILFFRLGDFYEMFLEDAKLAARELELTLTGRGKDQNRIPMCGVPWHASENYVAKLVAKGYKVAICEQVEDPALSKGITRREVVKVLTPGTLIETSVMDEKDTHYLAAVNPLPKGCFGISFADITTGEFQLFTVESLARLTTVLGQLAPRELLKPENLDIPCEDSVFITAYQPSSLQDAESELNRHFKVQSLSGFGCDAYREAYPAAWAILEYLRKTRKQELPHLVQLKPFLTREYLFMDQTTLRNLELVQTIYNRDKTGSLFWVLDHTRTAAGARRLRQDLKYPMVDPVRINHRLDAVEALKQDLLSREELRSVLNQVYDLERLTGRIATDQNNPRDCLALCESLEALMELGPILNQCSAGLLVELAGFFSAFNAPQSTYQQLIATIRTSIKPDAPNSLKDGGVIQPGYSEELDQLLLSFQNIREWIAGLEEKERERTGIRTLKVGFNRVFGYYFEISKGQQDKAPADYIRKQTLTTGERFITPELKEKESILLNGEAKQHELEMALYKDIISRIKAESQALQHLSEQVALVDVLQSLATVAQKNNYCRPEFAPPGDQILNLTQSRHPVLEKNSAVSFIPNAIHMSTDQDRFILITGPNMAGKSTLMRQIALVVVMAQIGSFVPAATCRISPVDKLFTRIGALDNLYFGQSTFMVEMLETASILHNATPASLIILDEIGRGTSTFDGMSIAFSVSEHIHTTLGARTLFATHYHELTCMEKQYPAFSNYSMKITEDRGRIVFTYQFLPGPADKSYGIHVAEMAGLPAVVVKRAQGILSGFEAHGSDYLSATKPKHTQLSLFE